MKTLLWTLFFSLSLEAKVTTETATLAGGCFWGMEEIIREIPGVLKTEVGYTGGSTKNATYLEVKTGRSGHAEAIQVEFDPLRLSFEKLLEWFFRMHNPTTKNQQGNDIGSQYRSAIFFHSEAQKATAVTIIDRVNKSGAWKAPVVTEVTAFDAWWSAEEYHQDYLKKNPGGYTCHFVREVKF
jgi:methionine-S-sulfoxide reductase